MIKSLAKILTGFIAIIIYLIGLTFSAYKVMIAEVDSKDERVMETMRREHINTLKSIEKMYEENRKDIREINQFLREKKR